MAHDRAAHAAIAGSERRLLSLRWFIDAVVLAAGADRTDVASRSLREADRRADVHPSVIASRSVARRPRMARPSTRRMFVSAKAVGSSRAKHATADDVYAPTPGSASRLGTVPGSDEPIRRVAWRACAGRVDAG